MDDRIIGIGDKNASPEEMTALLGSISLGMIMEHSKDSFYFKDLSSRFLLINQTLATRLGLENPALAFGKTDTDFYAQSHALRAANDELQIIQTRLPLIGQVERETWPNGETTWVSTSKYPLLNSNKDVIGTWGISRDISDLKEAEERLENTNLQLREANRQLEILSVKDTLSDLFNHRSFYEQAQKEVDLCLRKQEKHADTSLSIIVFDLDFFKRINDTHGHLIGDFTIRHVADLLKKTIRNTDTAFRYGGDEFVVLMPNTSHEEACKVAEKIRGVIESAPVESSSFHIDLTVSGGVASFDESSNLNEMFHKADQRLYQSKGKGRNRFSS